MGATPRKITQGVQRCRGGIPVWAPVVMETAHEVAIYIDRFHNLDLFQQGWYRMKIRALWEADEHRAPISPARVTQYEAVDIGAKGTFGFWKIDDVDNSFCTQPFLVKYSRQDIYLSVMVSFYIPNSEDEGPATSSVILKFELIYIPTLGNGWFKDSGDTDLVPVHEFRIPHKALLGLHSYCPVHFDALHSALVDLTIHIVYLKAGVTKSSLKSMEQSFGSKSYDIVKASLISREILLEGVMKISNAIGNTLEDLDGTDLTLGKYESIQPSKSGLSTCNKGKGTPTKCTTPQLTSILQEFLENSGVMVGNTADDVMLYTLSEEELFELFQIVSSQLSFIWNEFLKFHRTHRVKILDYLHAIWDFDRKAEWSIWIIHSKIDIPHRYLRTMNDGSPRHGHLRRISSSRKPIQNSMSQAELHRKSIAQMKGHHLDLRLVRNQWLLLDPGAECLLSQINEDRTSGDFKEMGRRLANEVVAFLKRRLDKYSKMGGCQEMKLSFVGHSIGNIILRSALTEPKLQPFLKNLYTYMSISGPHLGYWYSSNSLFNSGLWLMKRLKGMQCMAQLTFSDDNDPQNTFFYKLCKLKTLENFKNIILVSSPQDGYVPYHSARIDLCHASSSDNSRRGQVFTEMLNNCLDQIRAPTSETRVFMRCDVNFDQSAQGRSLNTMIGRAAHIEFLENEIYARFIMWSFPELFR
nr:protein FAM135A-like [Setaria viridis]